MVVLCILLLLTGCGRAGQTDDPAVDYNQYIFSHGYAGYSEDAYLFFNSNRLLFLEPTLTSPLSPLCARPDCDHRTSACSAYIDTDAIYVSGDNLYYIGMDRKYNYGLYEMDLQGGSRRLVENLSVLETPYSGFDFSYRIYSSWLALELEVQDADERAYMIWLTDLEHPNEDGEIIFGGYDNTSVAYTGVELRDGWLFTIASELSTGKSSLLGYNMEAGTSITLVEEWNAINTLSLRDGSLYWFVPGEGFFTKLLDEGTVTKYRDCNPDTEYGFGAYEDNYLVFTNAIPGVDMMESVSGEERGVSFYDYQGMLTQFIPVTDYTQHPAYLMSTPDYIFFFESGSTALVPAWYVEKAAIADGTAELIPVE